MFDCTRAVAIAPAFLDWYCFFTSGVLAHFTIDLNHRQVLCTKMLGGVLCHDPIVEFVRHPSLQFHMFAAKSQSGRLTICDYSKLLDSPYCNDAPELVYVVPHSPIVAFGKLLHFVDLL